MPVHRRDRRRRRSPDLRRERSPEHSRECSPDLRPDLDRDRSPDRRPRRRSPGRGRILPDCRSPRPSPSRDMSCRESIRYWRGILRGPWVIFEHGTVVMGLAAANRNDLANAAIVELTGIRDVVSAPICALQVGDSAWACRWPHANSRVWVRVIGTSCATRAADAARAQVDEDRGGLRIVYVRQ